MLWARQEVLVPRRAHQEADRGQGLAAQEPGHADRDLADQLLLADGLQRRHLARHPRAGHPRTCRALEVLPACRVLHRDPLPGGHRRRAGALRARADDDDGAQAHPAGARRPRRPGAAADPRDDRPRGAARPTRRRHQLARDRPTDCPPVAGAGGQGGRDGGRAHECGGHRRGYRPARPHRQTRCAYLLRQVVALAPTAAPRWARTNRR